MIHHYLQRGILPEKIINLPLSEKMFYKASLEVYLEDRLKELKAMAGGK